MEFQKLNTHLHQWCCKGRCASSRTHGAASGGAGGLGVHGNTALLHSDLTVSSNGPTSLLRPVGRPQQQTQPLQQLHQLPQQHILDHLTSSPPFTDGSAGSSPYSPASSSPFTRLSAPVPAGAAHETSTQLAKAAAAADTAAVHASEYHSPAFSSLSADTSRVSLNQDSSRRTAVPTSGAHGGLQPAAGNAAASTSLAAAEAVSGARAAALGDQEPADLLAQAAAEATAAQLRSWLTHLLQPVCAPTTPVATAAAAAPISCSSSSCLPVCQATSAAGARDTEVEVEAHVTTADSLCFPLPCYPVAAALSPVTGGLPDVAEFSSDGGRSEASTCRGCATVRLLVSPAAVAEAEAYHRGLAAGLQEGRAAREQEDGGPRVQVLQQEEVQEQRCGPIVRVVVSAPNCSSAWVDQEVAIQLVPSHSVQGDGSSGGTGAPAAAAEAGSGGLGAGLVTFQLPAAPPSGGPSWSTPSCGLYVYVLLPPASSPTPDTGSRPPAPRRSVLCVCPLLLAADPRVAAEVNGALRDAAEAVRQQAGAAPADGNDAAASEAGPAAVAVSDTVRHLSYDPYVQLAFEEHVSGLVADMAALLLQPACTPSTQLVGFDGEVRDAFEAEAVEEVQVEEEAAAAEAVAASETLLPYLAGRGMWASAALVVCQLQGRWGVAVRGAELLEWAEEEVPEMEERAEATEVGVAGAEEPCSVGQGQGGDAASVLASDQVQVASSGRPKPSRTDSAFMGTLARGKACRSEGGGKVKSGSGGGSLSAGASGSSSSPSSAGQGASPCPGDEMRGGVPADGSQPPHRFVLLPTDALVWLLFALKHLVIIKHLHAAGIDPSKAVTALVLCIGAPLLLLLLRPHTYARHRTRVIMLMYELPWQLLLTCQAVCMLLDQTRGPQRHFRADHWTLHDVLRVVVNPGLFGMHPAVVALLVTVRAVPYGFALVKLYGMSTAASAVRVVLMLLSAVCTAALLRQLRRAGDSAAAGL